MLCKIITQVQEEKVVGLSGKMSDYDGISISLEGFTWLSEGKCSSLHLLDTQNGRRFYWGAVKLLAFFQDQSGHPFIAQC